MSPDLPARLQQYSDDVGRSAAPQDGRRSLISLWSDRVIDSDAMGPERLELNGLNLDPVHPTMVERVVTRRF